MNGGSEDLEDSSDPKLEDVGFSLVEIATRKSSSGYRIICSSATAPDRTDRSKVTLRTLTYQTNAPINRAKQPAQSSTIQIFADLRCRLFLRCRMFGFSKGMRFRKRTSESHIQPRHFIYGQLPIIKASRGKFLVNSLCNAVITRFSGLLDVGPHRLFRSAEGR